MADCPVCCEAFTAAKRIKITCAYCQYDACAMCYRQYITSSMQDAHCMNCRHAWTRNVLGGYFPTTWVNGEYKKHREKILIEREKQLLPESQALVNNYRQAQDLREGLKQKHVHLRRLKREYAALNLDIASDRWTAERLEFNDYRGNNPIQMRAAQRAAPQRPKFTAPCPSETCRGFLGEDMKCGVCSLTACNACGMVLADGHECVQENVESFALVKKSTRPCPKCAIPTSRISGCSQMWCVECHTPWDWNTGQIVKGVIHNPHYFQFLRERNSTGEIPRQPGDAPCGGNNVNFPSGHAIAVKIRREMEALGKHADDSPEYRAKNTLGATVLDLQRRLTHVYAVELPPLRTQRFNRRDNADLRLKYLLNEIDEAEFKSRLQRREKRRDKQLAVRDIYQMVCDTGCDRLRAYLQGVLPLETLHGELVALQQYANTHLRTVQEQYKMSVKYV